MNTEAIERLNALVSIIRTDSQARLAVVCGASVETLHIGVLDDIEAVTAPCDWEKTDAVIDGHTTYKAGCTGLSVTPTSRMAKFCPECGRKVVAR